MAAVAASKSRVLIQSSWSALQGDDIPDSIYQLGPAPHDWLLPRMAAVVHHGAYMRAVSWPLNSCNIRTLQVTLNARSLFLHACVHDCADDDRFNMHSGAGTVAAGLKAGKPTLVCPFFGDQFFWGHMVYEKGVGPKPIPIKKLTPVALAAAFTQLRSPGMQTAAQAMAAVFDSESGVDAGLHAFYKHLPLDDMVCDVSVGSDALRSSAYSLPKARARVAVQAHIYATDCKALVQGTSLHVHENTLIQRAALLLQDLQFTTSLQLAIMSTYTECGMKLSYEADAAIHDHSTNSAMKKHSRREYKFVNYGLPGPQTVLQGAKEGIIGVVNEI
eukprot:16983-Heterococcus_DN1.PRE.1